MPFRSWRTTAQQLKVIDAEHQRNEQARRDLANLANKKRRGFDGGDPDLDFGESGDSGRGDEGGG